MDQHKMYGILQKAQDTYGYPNQVNVAMEELAELTAVLAKYPRFPDHTTAMEHPEFRGKVVDEMADVYIILLHLHMIFAVTPEELDNRMDLKLKRLERWLEASKEFYHTTVDREVESGEPQE